MMMVQKEIPTWIDSSLFPFTSKYLQLQSGNMHYIDEGKGKTILFVHGIPTWSFLYRHFVKDLSKKYRCIAIDHLGFGLSDKPHAFQGTPEAHAQNLAEFINKLDLKKIILVVHDFGGPIGLGSALENSERIDKVILFNSWLWATKEEKAVQKSDKLINSALGRFLYLTLNFSPKFLLKMGFADKKNLSKSIHKHCIKPFPNKKSRIQLLNLAKSLAGSSDWYAIQQKNLNKLADKDWLILWGTKDKFIPVKYLDRWRQLLPKAKIQELPCGHFVQEEMPKKCIEIIQNFI